MIGAALLMEKINKEGKVINGLGGLGLVIAAASLLAIPAAIFAGVWGALVDIPALLYGIFALNAMLLGSLPMIIVAGILGNFVDKLLPPILIGMAGLFVIFAASSLLGIPASLFSDAWGTIDSKTLLRLSLIHI